MRRIRFKPSLRTTMLGNAAWLAAQSPDGKLPADLAATMARSLPAAPKKRQPRADGLDMDAIHHGKRAAPLENEVIHAISQLLAKHPRVIWVARFNSGAASFNAANGNAYQPIWFHRFLKMPQKMRMPDFFGLMSCGLPLAIEAKRPGWTKPRDDREREQMAFLNMVSLLGGVALFATDAEQVAAALK